MLQEPVAWFVWCRWRELEVANGAYESAKYSANVVLCLVQRSFAKMKVHRLARSMALCKSSGQISRFNRLRASHWHTTCSVWRYMPSLSDYGTS
jgi:hypothetical protein